eukprot:349745-Chlamydomonas_euryale.AAC.4
MGKGRTEQSVEYQCGASVWDKTGMAKHGKSMLAAHLFDAEGKSAHGSRSESCKVWGRDMGQGAKKCGAGTWGKERKTVGQGHGARSEKVWGRDMGQGAKRCGAGTRGKERKGVGQGHGARSEKVWDRNMGQGAKRCGAGTWRKERKGVGQGHGARSEK